MTTTTTTGYAEAVRQALDDLPPATVSELVEGLDEHLAEVGVPDLVSLFALLGSPERYAADLRASAGLPPRATTPSPPLPPPVPPQAASARPAFSFGGRHLARVALAIVVFITVLSLAATADKINSLVVFSILIAVGAGALVLRWLARVADLPGGWTSGALVALTALTFAVAITASAVHPRTEYQPYPFDYATTSAMYPLPDFTNLPVAVAVNGLQKLNLVPVIVGRANPSSVVWSQDPPAGTYLPPGAEVRLILSPPAAAPTTFPASPSTTTFPASPPTTVPSSPSPTTTIPVSPTESPTSAG